MKKKLLILSGIILVLGIVIIGVFVYRKSKIIPFEDEKMRELMAKIAEVENPEDLTQEDLDKIKELNIGYTGYYETLSDIEKCPNLHTLIIGEPRSVICGYPFIVENIPHAESPERIEKIQKELGEILGKNSNLININISNEEGVCSLTNLDFLKNTKSLIWISLQDLGDLDYSSLYESSQIEYLYLINCGMKDLRGIEKLYNLKYLFITDTQMDLAPIIQCKKIEELTLKGCDLSTLGDLREMEELESITLDRCDLTPLGDFKKLEYVNKISLDWTDISEATNLLNCVNLEALSIKHTPLIVNYEELAKLWEAMPELDIY